MKLSVGYALAVFTGGVLVAGTSMAGDQSQPPSLTVDLSEPSIYGTSGKHLGSTTDDTNYIGCSLVGQSNQALVAKCRGRQGTPAGECTLTYPDAARMMGGDGYVDMIWNTTTNICSNVTTTVSSTMPYKPKDATPRTSDQVTFPNSNNDFVKGAKGTAYNTTDTQQYIGCLLKATRSSNSTSIACTAKNASNPAKTFDCTASGSSAASIIEAARGIKDDSYLEITRSGTTCTKLLVRNESRWAPTR